MSCGTTKHRRTHHSGTECKRRTSFAVNENSIIQRLPSAVHSAELKLRKDASGSSQHRSLPSSRLLGTCGTCHNCVGTRHISRRVQPFRRAELQRKKGETNLPSTRLLLLLNLVDFGRLSLHLTGTSQRSVHLPHLQRVWPLGPWYRYEVVRRCSYRRRPKATKPTTYEKTLPTVARKFFT